MRLLRSGDDHMTAVRSSDGQKRLRSAIDPPAPYVRNVL